MWNVNAVEETDREERKTCGGAGGRWVSVSAPTVACQRRGWLQKEHVGLCFCGVQDAAHLIQPFLGRVLQRWRAPVLLSASQLVPVGEERVDCW